MNYAALSKLIRAPLSLSNKNIPKKSYENHFAGVRAKTFPLIFLLYFARNRAHLQGPESDQNLQNFGLLAQYVSLKETWH